MLAAQKTLHFLIMLPGLPCMSWGLHLQTLALDASSPHGLPLNILLVKSSRGLYVVCEWDCHVCAVKDVSHFGLPRFAVVEQGSLLMLVCWAVKYVVLCVFPGVSTSWASCTVRSLEVF